MLFQRDDVIVRYVAPHLILIEIWYQALKTFVVFHPKNNHVYTIFTWINKT